jgi:hypothetical protein
MDLEDDLSILSVFHLLVREKVKLSSRFTSWLHLQCAAGLNLETSTTHGTQRL